MTLTPCFFFQELAIATASYGHDYRTPGAGRPMMGGDAAPESELDDIKALGERILESRARAERDQRLTTNALLLSLGHPTIDFEAEDEAADAKKAADATKAANLLALALMDVRNNPAILLSLLRPYATTDAESDEFFFRAAMLRAKLRASRREIDIDALQVAIFNRPRVVKPRKANEKRMSRYRDQPDKQGKAKWRYEFEKSIYWTDYHCRLKDAAHYELPENADKDKNMRDRFKHGIRMPLAVYQKLRNEMDADPEIMKDPAKDPLPLPVLLMASLRYLALGCIWDGFAEIFHRSRPPLVAWFKDVFLPWMMKHKYREYVKYPKTHEELRAVVEPFEAAGFPGMCGLSDGVHVWYGGYNSSVRHRFFGKERYPTVVWNVTVDYYGRPIFVSTVAPGTMNDKSIAEEKDEFLSEYIHGPPFNNFEYELLTDTGTLSTKGAYLGVDNGYQDWRVFIPPYKHQLCGDWSYTWSKWHESLRKKVECFFGRLKARYRCLANKVSFVDLLVVDKMFKVCCCLDVMVREYDDNFAMMELDWRQLDADELRRAAGDDGDRWLRRKLWLGEFSDVPARERVLPPDDRQVDVTAPAPGDALASANRLRSALIHHFKRFKPQWRAQERGSNSNQRLDQRHVGR